MTPLTQKHFFPWTRVTETSCRPLRLTTIVAGLLLTMIPFLTGCGGDSGGGEGQASESGITASLAWQPAQDPSVDAYFVHYGRQSPGRRGSCAYESSQHTASPSATVTDLEPNTLYYFTVSAYNGLESACSNEVSTVTSPVSVETDRPGTSYDPRNPGSSRDPNNPGSSRNPSNTEYAPRGRGAT
ncbi:MAG: fibronectin type III domain-containing protein [Nitrospiraceae bacterium]|nr:fibronectin type III domain-containing protein [Nitrospiraceae bacterium]